MVQQVSNRTLFFIYVITIYVTRLFCTNYDIKMIGLYRNFLNTNVANQGCDMNHVCVFINIQITILSDN